MMMMMTRQRKMTKCAIEPKEEAPPANTVSSAPVTVALPNVASSALEVFSSVSSPTSIVTTAVSGQINQNKKCSKAKKEEGPPDMLSSSASTAAAALANVALPLPQAVSSSAIVGGEGGPAPATFPTIQAQLPAAQGGSVRHQDRIQQAIQVKLEESEAKKEEQEKVERGETKTGLDRLPPPRRARAEAWLLANIDPVTQQGRKVFRRGCHARCITTLLGGQGTDPSPMLVNEPPEYPQEYVPNNPFIQRGEFYFAGRGDWNPWGPSFPGDAGLIDSQAVTARKSELDKGFDRTKQKSFHLFVQCSKHPWEAHYHGPNARGKYMYMGKYRCVPSDPDAEVEETSRTFLFNELSEESKRTMAAYFKKHQRTIHWYDGVDRMQVTPQDVPQQADIVQAWIEVLVEKGYRIEIVPVEFVEYDEGLYRALVAEETYNGEASTRFEDIGPV